jgi:hypothetical protein
MAGSSSAGSSAAGSSGAGSSGGGASVGAGAQAAISRPTTTSIEITNKILLRYIFGPPRIVVLIFSDMVQAIRLNYQATSFLKVTSFHCQWF